MAQTSNAASFPGDHNSGTQIGQLVNTGTIHLTQVRREEIIPSHNVPFERDAEFVGREDIIAQIREKSRVGRHTRIALVGLGGIGKSQVAIEYAYRIRNESPGTWVFWVYANDAGRFTQAYRSIAATVKLPGREDPHVDILQRVYEWLTENGPWLLILDNADDPTVFRSALARYLPQTSNGTILVTSRFDQAARQLVGPFLIRIEPMAKLSALELLRAKLGAMNESDAAELVHLLEGFPLAITHAAAYIDSREMSIREYIKLFYAGNETYLLSDTDVGDLRRDPEVHHSVILTWQISFQQIKQVQPLAVDLLALMSVLDRTAIPEILLIGDMRERDFKDGIATLRNFSLIGVAGQGFQLHRLVQLATWAWLEIRQELKKWTDRAIEHVATSFPIGKYENWALCETLLPHARIVATYQAQNRSIVLAQASINYNMGYYLRGRGEYILAEKLDEQVIAVRKRVLGEEHPDTLASTHALASIYANQGRWNEAEQIFVQVMAARKRVLGEEHPNTLASTHALASIYANQGRWNEAEQIFVQVMAARKRVLGEEHPDTLDSIRGLASIYANQGRWNEAEQIFVQVMAARKRVLGEEHPDTLDSIRGLAKTYRRQGRLNEAEQILKK